MTQVNFVGLPRSLLDPEFDGTAFELNPDQIHDFLSYLKTLE
ncbi:hypothetical protein [Bradyrhizobium sp. 1(2017)]|nr:hypothetical protein [Bradyrhizobium sp. 1(2017)]